MVGGDAAGFDLGNHNEAPYSLTSDQIIAYQGDDANPVFLAAISVGAPFATSGSVDDSNSLLPPGLTVGDTAIELTSFGNDDAYFKGLLFGTPAMVRSELNDASNYQEPGVIYNRRGRHGRDPREEAPNHSP